MRLLADDRVAKSVTLYLAPDEAEDLIESLKMIVADPVAHQHEHVSDKTYRREITVAVYVPENLDQFDERSRRLILDDA